MGLTVLDDWLPCVPLLSLLPLLSVYDWCEGGMNTVEGLDETGSMYIRLVCAVILVGGLVSCLLNLRKKKGTNLTTYSFHPPI